MSHQYDNIAHAWEKFRGNESSTMIADNVKEELGQLPENNTVLELACGTGFFTKHALDRGASNIIALDISSKMIEAAIESFPAEYAGQVTFNVADCADLSMWKSVDALNGREGTFDVVLAGWLLNYAASEEELTNMFRNICTALKPSGRFIGVTIPAKLIDQYKAVSGATKVNEAFPGLIQNNIGNVQGGYKMRNEGTGGISYEYYFLGPDVYQRAAQAAGLQIEWEDVVPSKALVEKHGQEFFRAYYAKPICALCLAKHV